MSSETWCQRVRPHLFPLLCLLLASCAVYGRILGHEFLSNWDDNKYVLENPTVQGISWLNVQALFTRYYVGNYAPVHLLSYMLDYALWGLRPGGFLLVNLIVHTLNGLLLYRLFSRLLPDRLTAWFGAAFFLLHPVQVESVAWISQRKNLLALFFFLLAWEFYIVYRDRRVIGRGGYYAASLTALLLALLSKSAAVIFPLAMLLFDHCYPPSIGKPQLRDKVPYLFVSVLVAVLAIQSQTPDLTEWGAGGGRAVAYHGGGPLATFLTMLTVCCSYLRIIVWPFNLSAFYDPVIHTSFDLPVLAALAFLGGISILIYLVYCHDRRIAFWALFAVIALLPVSQIVPLVTLMNDRYLYFPFIGVSALLMYGIHSLVLRLPRFRPHFKMTFFLILLFYAGISLHRCGVWRDAVTLWSDAAEKSPRSWVVFENLGEALYYTAIPQRVEAIAAFKRAIELNPASDISRYNLGVVYLDLNDHDNADKVFSELLRRTPAYVIGWAAYGDLAMRRFDYQSAESHYRRALELQPGAVQVLRSLGNLMMLQQRVWEAREIYLQIDALERGAHPQTAMDLARVESINGDTEASFRWLEQALRRGYADFAGIMDDEALIPVRLDGRFDDLIKAQITLRTGQPGGK